MKIHTMETWGNEFSSEEPQNAEILEQNSENRKRWKVKSVTVELMLVFVLGVLLGMVIKTEAAKRITIGFNDYKAAQLKNSYDFAKIEKDLFDQAKAQNAAGAPPNEAGN